jgi:hypothetical protein
VAGGRKRAVGTRDRVLSHLATVGEISDSSGMASTALADAVGYPGSSVAFAQLLSGMERSGLIKREIRGKRTYRIAPAKAAAARRGGPDGSGSHGRVPAPRAQASRAQAARAAAPAARAAAPAARAAAPAARGAAPAAAPAATATTGPRPAMAARHDRQRAGGDERSGRDLIVASAAGVDLDYDELARRLLVQVVQRLAVTSGDDQVPGRADMAGPAGTGPAGTGAGDAALQQTVASLEQKLASVQSKQRRLTAENAKLREQLQAAQQSLAQAQERDSADRIAGRFDTAEVRLLERLLSPLRDKGDRHEEAGAG